MAASSKAGANFGNLKERQQAYDFEFAYGSRVFRIKPSAEEVLNFHLEVSKIAINRGGNVPMTGTDIWTLATPLLGGVFDPETAEFGPDPDKPGKEGRVIMDLLKAGIDYDTLDLLITTTYLRYQWDEYVAEAYMETRDLGKAFKLAASRRSPEENDEQETPEAPGGTSTGDSAENETD